MSLVGMSGAVFNAAKETALEAFLSKKIGFLDMSTVVEKTIAKICYLDNCHRDEINLANILNIDEMARIVACELFEIHRSMA